MVNIMNPWQDPSYQKFLNSGGAIGITYMESTEDTLANHAKVLDSILETFDIDALINLKPPTIKERNFHGTWYDYANELLVFDISDPSKKIKNPKDRGTYFIDMPSFPDAYGIYPPDFNSGNFAYAFCQPPYPLDLSPQSIQNLYSDIIQKICPKHDVRILNWYSEALINLAPELKEGTEWWGVFVFTIYVKSTRTIFALVAAETD